MCEGSSGGGGEVEVCDEELQFVVLCEGSSGGGGEVKVALFLMRSCSLWFCAKVAVVVVVK